MLAENDFFNDLFYSYQQATKMLYILPLFKYLCQWVQFSIKQDETNCLNNGQDYPQREEDPRKQSCCL